MQATMDSSFQDLFTHVIGGMAKAVSDHPGENPQQGTARVAATVRMILNFLPRDGIEAMLAGHCVMFHELLTDCVGKTVRGEEETLKRGHAGLLGMNRAFLNSLDRLIRYQRRLSEGSRDAPRAKAPSTPAPEAPVQEPPRQEAAPPMPAPKTKAGAAPFRPLPPAMLTSAAAARAVLRAGEAFAPMSGHGMAAGVPGGMTGDMTGGITGDMNGGVSRRPGS